jgi:hypothetical protein
MQLVRPPVPLRQSMASGGEYERFHLVGNCAVLVWILGFTVFHVASALIHILVVVAILAVILHFVRRLGSHSIGHRRVIIRDLELLF